MYIKDIYIYIYTNSNKVLSCIPNGISLTVLESTGGTWGKTKSDVVRMILYGPLDILFLSNRLLQRVKQNIVHMLIK